MKANRYDTKLTGLSPFQVRECVEVARRLGVSIAVSATTVVIRVRPATVLDAARAHHASLVGDRGRRQASASVLRKLHRLVPQ